MSKAWVEGGNWANITRKSSRYNPQNLLNYCRLDVNGILVYYPVFNWKTVKQGMLLSQMDLEPITGGVLATIGLIVCSPTLYRKSAD
jgi:hypothetical protein